MSRRTIALLLLCRLLPAAAQAPAAETVAVAMRDGVKLSTDVYRPAGDGPWPVVLLRTPYSRTRQSGDGELIRRGGYVAVIQDVRGRGSSEGRNYPFVGDGWGALTDGADTCRWLVAQPWCNGAIATTGGSALGITQLFTAPSQPPGVRCQWIEVAAGDFYGDATHIGGAFCKSLVERWLEGNRYEPAALADLRGHDCRDDYYQGYNADAVADKVNLPAVFVGGWYDVFQQGTIDAFTARQLHGGPQARGRQRLIIGPWPHDGGGGGKPVGELQYPDNARRAPREAPSQEAWLAYWLRGEQNGVLDKPVVCYYLMGACGEPLAPGNVWRTAEAWPPESQAAAWYLHPAEALRRYPPPAGVKPRAFRYDPAHPVPTRGGCNLTIPAGPMDQRPVESRPDVLLFTSDPLEHPLEVIGRLTAKVWVASSAPDTDLTVKLTDVYPDGRSMLVADGIRRLRLRNGFEQPQPLTPGQAVEVSVDLWSTALVFNRGHRLRVAISASNYPRFDANPNAGPPWDGTAAPKRATNTIYLDRDHPSALVLPVTAWQ
jgi:hypothetical protein